MSLPQVTPENIAVVGVSHRTAPLAERERFAFAPSLARTLLQSGGERLLLITCNRTELYTLDRPGALENELCRAAGAVEASLFAHQGKAAVGHLFSVASGLDSMVIGEHQILGQVKRAAQQARDAGALGPVLDELSRRAIQVGRRVRRETDLGRNLPSIPKVAVGVARMVMRDLEGRRVLVVGTGKLGDLTARRLRQVGRCELKVTNRRADRAVSLAERVGGVAESFTELDRLLAEADLVLACTAAASPVITRASVERALAVRENRPLVLIDIAVPRDVAPDVRELPGARLFDLDDLREWSSEAISPRTLEDARTIVASEAEGFLGWLGGRSAVPTIRALHARAEEILGAEVERWPEADREAARRFGRRLMRKLLHHPVRRLRDRAASEGEQYVALARDLFALENEPDGRGDGDRGER